jgi:hypothetical protein
LSMSEGRYRQYSTHKERRNSLFRHVLFSSEQLSEFLSLIAGISVVKFRPTVADNVHLLSFGTQCSGQVS